MEQLDTHNKQTYETLDEASKVKAILGATMEPITKSRAIELSGIPYPELLPETKQKVDDVFSSVGIEATEDEETKFRLNDDERTKLEDNVEMKSVYGVIAKKMKKEMLG